MKQSRATRPRLEEGQGKIERQGWRVRTFFLKAHLHLHSKHVVTGLTEIFASLPLLPHCCAHVVTLTAHCWAEMCDAILEQLHVAQSDCSIRRDATIQAHKFETHLEINAESNKQETVGKQKRKNIPDGRD